jgi:hypothetical protein
MSFQSLAKIGKLEMFPVFFHDIKTTNYVKQHWSCRSSRRAFFILLFVSLTIAFYCYAIFSFSQNQSRSQSSTKAPADVDESLTPSEEHTITIESSVQGNSCPDDALSCKCYHDYSCVLPAPAGSLLDEREDPCRNGMYGRLQCIY